MAGIYLHIPFCKQACFYCDFHFSTSLKRKSEMINAIANELIIRKNEITEPIETIYFGGGTPSVLTTDEILFLLNTIFKNFDVISTPEITLEANPDDLSKNKIMALSKSPINRLSIGVQSFFEDDLKYMNRAHTAEESMKCLTIATHYFDNITIDLIYGIPKMDSEKWKKNLQKTFDLGINHISSYALTVEPKTALESFIKKGKYQPLNTKQAAQHFNILLEETAKKGFVHYEISNFGKPNYFSKHNTSYWLGKQYLGVGPSAHSYNGKERSWNVANNVTYIKHLQQNKLTLEKEILTKTDKFNETIMTGLRTIWGVSLQNIEKEFGVSFLEKLQKSSAKFIKQNLLKIELNNGINTLKTTEKGKFLIDGITADLFIVN